MIYVFIGTWFYKNVVNLPGVAGLAVGRNSNESSQNGN
jgi:hypothetical protein